MYHCFLDDPHTALHPAQISRRTGIPFTEVSVRLEQTPELFVKLPRRPDGVTRYRLTSAASALTPEQVESMLMRQARKETFMLYAVGSMVLLLMLIVLILVGPALG